MHARTVSLSCSSLSLSQATKYKSGVRIFGWIYMTHALSFFSGLFYDMYAYVTSIMHIYTYISIKFRDLNVETI